MDKPYLATLQTTMKVRRGSPPTKVGLGRHTLIVGGNGSGKSAITQSAELLVAGACSDLAGRETVKSKSHVSWSADKPPEMTGWLDTGQVISYPATGRASPPGTLPMLDVVSGFRASQSRGLTTLLRWCAPFIEGDAVAEAVLLSGAGLAQNAKTPAALIAALTQREQALRALTAEGRAAAALLDALRPLAARHPVTDEVEVTTLRKATMHATLPSAADVALTRALDAARRNGRAQAFAEEVARLQQEVSTAKAQAAVLKNEVSSISAIIVNVIEGSIAPFVADVQRYLPDRFRVGIGVSPLRLGLRGPSGVEHGAPSGAEWAALTTAVACAIGDRQPGLSLVVLPDRAWDPPTLRVTMEALSLTNCQVLLTSTILPSEPVEGWQILRTRK